MYTYELLNIKTDEKKTLQGKSMMDIAKKNNLKAREWKVIYKF